jgi:hypothetical protein
MPEWLKAHCIDANGQPCPFVEGHLSGPIAVVIDIDHRVTETSCSYLQIPPPGLPPTLILRVPPNG